MDGRLAVTEAVAPGVDLDEGESMAVFELPQEETADVLEALSDALSGTASDYRIDDELY